MALTENRKKENALETNDTYNARKL